jgi:membrane protease YdiL (CAAX protease family)
MATTELRKRQPAARPWLFLVVWILAGVALSFGQFVWCSKDPFVRYWTREPQGVFVSILLPLLLGVVIIAAMERAKISNLATVFSLNPSLCEIRFRWIGLGILIAYLTTLRPRSWGGGEHIIHDAVLQGSSEGGLLYIVGVAVLSPIFEEAILRGYLYRAFRDSYGRLIGTLLVAAISVVLHFNAVRGSFFAAYFYAGLAVLICYILDSRGNLMDCIVFHTAYNIILIFRNS